MRNTRLLIALLFALTLGAGVGRAQHLVLFETMTNSCNPQGSAADQIRKTFTDAVTSTLANKGSQVMHLDHHFGNLCDFLNNAYSPRVAAMLWPPGNNVFFSGVNRAVFSTTGNRASVDPNDWASQIDAESALGAGVTISPVDIRLDTLNNQNFIFSTKVAVTLNVSTSDSIVIRYAVLQDNALDNLDGSPNVTVNDAVRFLSMADTGVLAIFPHGGSSGSSVNALWYGPLSFGSGVQSRSPYVWHNMRLVAWCEDHNQGVVRVLNAAVLAPHLDNLPLPPQSLTIISDSLDGKTFKLGSNLPIFYNSTTVHHVNAYYSPDNGSTWTLITPANSSPIYWTLPDTLPPTTQGKVKVEEVGGDGLVSIEKGTFSIAAPASLKILHPNKLDTLHSGQKFTISWSKNQVDTVQILVRYGLNPFKVLKDQVVHDSTWLWAIPDTQKPAIAVIQIVPTQTEVNNGAAAQTSDQFVIYGMTKGVPTQLSLGGFSITNLYPNPVAAGAELSVEYAVETSSDLSFDLLDLLGHNVMHQELKHAAPVSRITLPTTSLPTGTYILRMSDGTRSVSRRIETLR